MVFSIEFVQDTKFFFLFRKCGGFILWKIQVDLQTDFSKCFIIVVYPNGPQHPQLGRVFFLHSRARDTPCMAQYCEIVLEPKPKKIRQEKPPQNEMRNPYEKWALQPGSLARSCNVATDRLVYQDVPSWLVRYRTLTKGSDLGLH